MNSATTLRPSSASRWAMCGGSAAAEVKFPETEPSEAAREGTCAAWVAEFCLRGDAGCAADLVGRVHTNGVEVDEDMAIFVQFYLDEVARLAEGGSILVEHQVSLGPHVAGTLDSAVWVHIGSTLRVIDLKYGWRIVEPVKNAQLICYGGGLLEQTGWHPETVELIIVQPRPIHPGGPTRAWRVSGSEFRTWSEWIKACAIVARSPNAPFVAGDHCAYCQAAASCSTLAAAAYDAFDKTDMRAVGKIPAERLGVEYAFLERAHALVEMRKNAVESEMRARIERGASVPGWGMLSRTGKRKFKFPPEVVFAMTGIDPFEPKVVTPAELERRGASKEVVATLTEIPHIGRKLTRIDESVATRMFGAPVNNNQEN